MNYNLEIDIDAFDLDCSYCHMEDNCSITFGECRTYNKVLWGRVDRSIRQFRKDIFNSIIKEAT